jgi:hypothetical protein
MAQPNGAEFGHLTLVVSSSLISEQLIQALQNALLEVEASAGMSPDDPAFLALKSIVLQRIANLQLAKTQAADSDGSASESSRPGAIEAELSTEAA